MTKQQLLHYLAHRVPVVSADFDFRFTDAQMHRITQAGISQNRVLSTERNPENPVISHYPMTQMLKSHLTSCLSMQEVDNTGYNKQILLQFDPLLQFVMGPLAGSSSLDSLGSFAGSLLRLLSCALGCSFGLLGR